MLRSWLLLVLLLFGCRPVPAAVDDVRAGAPRDGRPEAALVAGSGLPDEVARGEAGAELVVPDGARTRRHPAPHAAPACAAAANPCRSAPSPDRASSPFSLPGGRLPYYATAPPGLPG